MELLRAPRALTNRSTAPGELRLPHPKHIRLELSPAAGGRACGLLHHLLHFSKLLEQTVHFADRPSRALRNTRPSRSVHDLGLLAFFERHRQDDRLYVLEPL